MRSLSRVSAGEDGAGARKGLELYAEGETRQQISTLSLSDAFRTFFELRKPEGYLAIIAFLNSNPLVELALGTLA